MYEAIKKKFREENPKASFTAQIRKLKKEAILFTEAESDYASDPSSHLLYAQYQQKLADLVISAINLTHFIEMRDLIIKELKKK